MMRPEMPNIGEVLVIGHLHALGYAVSRQRVRNAIHATDPLNTALRWRGILTTRQPYSVAGPNSLWHIGIRGGSRFFLGRGQRVAHAHSVHPQVMSHTNAQVISCQ